MQSLYVRAVLTRRDYDQTDLADVASQGTISDILAGRRGISKALAKKLAGRLVFLLLYLSELKESLKYSSVRGELP